LIIPLIPLSKFLELGRKTKTYEIEQEMKRRIAELKQAGKFVGLLENEIFKVMKDMYLELSPSSVPPTRQWIKYFCRRNLIDRLSLGKA